MILENKEIVQGVTLRSPASDNMYDFNEMHFIRYYINAALYAIEELHKHSKNKSFLSEIEYCHFYIDCILNYIGNISNRFDLSEESTNDDISCTNDINNSIKDRRKINTKILEFNEQDYPILSNKCPRNFNVHADEKNFNAIGEYGSISFFNVIFNDNDKGIIETLNNEKKYFFCILDLRDHIIHINGYCKGDKKAQKINIDKLKDELKRLKNQINDCKSFRG